MTSLATYRLSKYIRHGAPPSTGTCVTNLGVARDLAWFGVLSMVALWGGALGVCSNISDKHSSGCDIDYALMPGNVTMGCALASLLVGCILVTISEKQLHGVNGLGGGGCAACCRRNPIAAEPPLLVDVGG